MWGLWWQKWLNSSVWTQGFIQICSERVGNCFQAFLYHHEASKVTVQLSTMRQTQFLKTLICNTQYSLFWHRVYSLWFEHCFHSIHLCDWLRWKVTATQNLTTSKKKKKISKKSVSHFLFFFLTLEPDRKIKTFSHVFVLSIYSSGRCEGQARTSARCIWGKLHSSLLYTCITKCTYNVQ